MHAKGARVTPALTCPIPASRWAIPVGIPDEEAWRQALEQKPRGRRISVVDLIAPARRLCDKRFQFNSPPIFKALVIRDANSFLIHSNRSSASWLVEGVQKVTDHRASGIIFPLQGHPAWAPISVRCRKSSAARSKTVGA